MSTIKLESGRVISLHSLSQRPIYDGISVGYPNKRHNDELIERYLRQAMEMHGKHVALIEPARNPEITPFYEPSGWGPPEYLPKLFCHAVFESGRISDEAAFSSVLHILWFQEKFALPIDPVVVEKISKLNWDAVACDWSD